MVTNMVVDPKPRPWPDQGPMALPVTEEHPVA